MRIHQLSLFLENKPGQLSEPCRLLAQTGINVRTLTLADTEEFGILRLIVSDWERAAKVLEYAGYVVKVTEVFAVEVADRPGGLSDLLEELDRTGVNIEYMYAYPFGRGDKALMVFRFDKPELAIPLLEARR